MSGKLSEFYAAYAGAFEHAILDDDWTRIEPYFNQDAVLVCHSAPFQARAEGLDDIVDHFRRLTDSFDRRFDERAVEVIGSEEEGQRVTIRWRTTFRVAGAPDLVLSGHEIAGFRNGRIASLDEEFEPGIAERVIAWMGEHEQSLRPAVADMAESLLAAARNRLH